MQFVRIVSPALLAARRLDPGDWFGVVDAGMFQPPAHYVWVALDTHAQLLWTGHLRLADSRSTAAGLLLIRSRAARRLAVTLRQQAQDERARGRYLCYLNRRRLEIIRRGVEPLG